MLRCNIIFSMVPLSTSSHWSNSLVPEPACMLQRPRSASNIASTSMNSPEAEFGLTFSSTDGTVNWCWLRIDPLAEASPTNSGFTQPFGIYPNIPNLPTPSGFTLHFSFFTTRVHIKDDNFLTPAFPKSARSLLFCWPTKSVLGPLEMFWHLFMF